MSNQTSKNYLFIINDAPYGNERPYNALRLAMNLLKREGVIRSVTVCLSRAAANARRTVGLSNGALVTLKKASR